jgi:hypothetical protein
MHETAPFEPPQSFPDRERSFPKLILILGVVLAASAGAYFWFAAPKAGPVLRNEPHLPSGAAEQAYAQRIQIENIALSRAENFANQEIISLSAEMANLGDRSLKTVEVTVEFSDEMPQVVLREPRILFGTSSTPLSAGGRREFEVSFEHVPSSWNMQQPVVRVTGIQFTSTNK